MSFPPHGVPPDDPNLEIYEHAHAIDHDMVSTNLAISIHRAAMAVGHPDDPDAARTAMTGPAGAAAIQATMNPFLDEAIGFDECAGEYAGQAVDWAHQARAHVDQRSRCPRNR